MKQTFYKEALYHAKVAAEMLGKSLAATVEAHPAATVLIISLCTNIILFVELAQARSERDYYNQQSYIEQTKIDSLSILAPHWKGGKTR